MMDADYTAQEKAALITWHLALGEGLQTRDIVKLTGLTRQGAWELMQHLSRVIPIYQDDTDTWAVCSMLELEYAGV